MEPLTTHHNSPRLAVGDDLGSYRGGHNNPVDHLDNRSQYYPGGHSHRRNGLPGYTPTWLRGLQIKITRFELQTLLAENL